jgi:hypothetical protein
MTKALAMVRLRRRACKCRKETVDRLLADKRVRLKYGGTARDSRVAETAYE